MLTDIEFQLFSTTDPWFPSDERQLRGMEGGLLFGQIFFGKLQGN